MKYLKTAWYWLMFSSNNPQAISLTIKGVLVTLLTYVTVAAGLAHISLPSDILTQVVDAIVMFVQSVLMAISIAITIVGLVRKLFKTFAGTNSVLQ
jgi:hypothetical protein